MSDTPRVDIPRSEAGSAGQIGQSERSAKFKNFLRDFKKRVEKGLSGNTLQPRETISAATTTSPIEQTTQEPEARTETDNLQVFRDSKKFPDKILYHATNNYDPDQGGLDPAHGKGDGRGRVWLRAGGPHSTGGIKILAINQDALDSKHLHVDDRGYISYDKIIPPEAILDLGRRPGPNESIHDLIAEAVARVSKQTTAEK